MGWKEVVRATVGVHVHLYVNFIHGNDNVARHSLSSSTCELKV
jgi:hypothetical protein